VRVKAVTAIKLVNGVSPRDQAYDDIGKQLKFQQPQTGPQGPAVFFIFVLLNKLIF